MDDLLFENECFQIEHANYYRIAGLLFVKPKVSVAAIQDLSLAALELLGPTLKIACEAVESVLQPANTYCAKFGESGAGLHFHIFPRTLQLTEKYQQSGHSVSPLDGPHLMSWANSNFIGNREHGDIPRARFLLKAYFQEFA